jgi:hypothetical protein
VSDCQAFYSKSRSVIIIKKKESKGLLLQGTFLFIETLNRNIQLTNLDPCFKSFSDDKVLKIYPKIL